MNSVINKFKSMSFEARTIFTVRFSIIYNMIIAIAKFILAIIISDVFFYVAGTINMLMLFAKLNCYNGIKNKDNNKNSLIAILLMLVSIQYIIYMSRLIFNNISLTNYGPIISILIAAVAFTELAFSIIGCFKSIGKGYLFKNIKLINFSSAMTAIVLTEMSLMTFAEGNTDINLELISGLFGVLVGVIILIIAAYVLIQPKISILGKERNVYQYKNGSFEQEKISIKLTNSKFYADYYYEANVINNIADGVIVKGKNPIKSWDIWILVVVITLSEILIFPYAAGALVRHFKDIELLKVLDNKMQELGFEKVDIE